MKKSLTIGADVGGSHISCGVVDMPALELGVMSTLKLDSNTEKKQVLEKWAEGINAVVQNQGVADESIHIGFAMPGPFDYKNGIALFDENVDKYQHLYSVSIPDELPAYLVKGNYTFRFINDAVAFAVGAVNAMQLNHKEKMIVLTLGTGLGACFLEKGVPIFKSEDIPESGWLWNQEFKDGIGDAYFSTRWFVKRFFEQTGKQISGVREMIASSHEVVPVIFQEYVQHMAAFLAPHIKKFKPSTILLGGNIAKASDYFLADLNTSLAKLNVEIVVSTIGEEAAIIGSAQLFDAGFWEKIKNDL
ncbi:ROK family protein [Flagellimonas sp. HMM57]|uniref:ROK family protein n=1 Tax=unclassified Flagellimonas TaxID=2644544 RepID=UPI0013D463CA|nr:MULTISPECIES: ROK family protein [unclassified Flagellimonas]UII74771.1 ROK family protein [Flagellimonas sp. HMM57]